MKDFRRNKVQSAEQMGQPQAAKRPPLDIEIRKRVNKVLPIPNPTIQALDKGILDAVSGERSKARTKRLNAWLIEKAKIGHDQWDLAFRYRGDLKHLITDYQEKFPEERMRVKEFFVVPHIWDHAFQIVEEMLLIIEADERWDGSSEALRDIFNSKGEVFGPWLSKYLYSEHTQEYMAQSTAESGSDLVSYLALERESMVTSVLLAAERHLVPEITKTVEWFLGAMEQVLDGNRTLKRQLLKVRNVDEAWSALRRPLHKYSVSRAEFEELFHQLDDRYKKLLKVR